VLGAGTVQRRSEPAAQLPEAAIAATLVGGEELVNALALRLGPPLARQEPATARELDSAGASVTIAARS